MKKSRGPRRNVRRKLVDDKHVVIVGYIFIKRTVFVVGCDYIREVCRTNVKAKRLKITIDTLTAMNRFNLTIYLY